MVKSFFGFFFYLQPVDSFIFKIAAIICTSQASLTSITESSSESPVGICALSWEKKKEKEKSKEIHKRTLLRLPK